MDCLARCMSLIGLVASLASWSFAAEGGPPPASRLPDDVAFVAGGLQQMLDGRLAQATGTVYASYQERDPAGGDTVFDRSQKYDFFLDGEKIRWDRWDRPADASADYVIQHKHAFNGDVVNEVRYTADGQAAPAAHVRSREWLRTSDKRTFTGSAFNPRYLYLPQEFVRPNKSITEWLEEWVQYGGEVSVEGSVNQSSLVDLRVVRRKANPHSGKEVAMEVRVSVDLAHNFLLRKSAYLVDDAVVAQESYEYSEAPGSGEPILTKWVKERYVPGNRRPSTQTFEITYASLNEAVPESAFTLAGFDLPPGMTIIDTRNGLKYKYGGVDYAEAELNDKLAFLEEQGVMPVHLASETTQGSSLPDERIESNQIPIVGAAVPARRAQSRRSVVLVAIAGLVFAAGIGGIYLRSHANRS